MAKPKAAASGKLSTRSSRQTQDDPSSSQAPSLPTSGLRGGLPNLPQIIPYQAVDSPVGDEGQMLIDPEIGEGTEGTEDIQYTMDVDDNPQAESSQAAAATTENPWTTLKRLAEEGNWLGKKESKRQETMIHQSVAPKAREPVEPKVRFSDIENPRAMNCSIMSWKHMRTRPIIGSLWGNQNGYSIKLHVDAGRFGNPRIMLAFRINKGNTKDRPFSNKPGESTEFKVFWRPGLILANNQPMISSIDYTRIKDLPSGVGSNHPFVVSDNGKVREPQTLERLTSLDITYNDIMQQDVDMDEWVGLPQPVREALEALFFNSQGHDKVTIWFHSQPGLDMAYQRWIGTLLVQANNHLPPYHQYLNAEGDLSCSLADSPLVHEVGKGMYVLRKTRDGKPTDIYSFPPRTTFESFAEFGLNLAVPVLRDAQFQRIQSTHIDMVSQLLYLQKLPVPSVGKAVKDLVNKFYGFVRIQRFNGVVGKSPPVGSIVWCEFDNSNPREGKSHQSDDKPKWRGVVVEHDHGCQETKTHFCIVLTKPHGQIAPVSMTSLHNCTDSQLYRVLLKVQNDTVAAQRELYGASNLSNPAYDPETLGPIRRVFMQDSDNWARESRDMTTAGNGSFQEFLNYASTTCNRDQLKVIQSLTAVVDKIVAIVGPPGTGKTLTLAQLISAALVIGHKICVVGPTNEAVDNAAIRCLNAYEQVPTRIKSEKQKKFLRLEVQGSEMRALTTIKNYNSPQVEELYEVPTVESQQHIEDDPVVSRALASMVADHTKFTKELKTFCREVRDYNAAVERLRQVNITKGHKVPLIMTSGYHLHNLQMTDRRRAEAAFSRVKQAWLYKMMSEAETDALVARKEIASSEEYNALRQPAVTEEEFSQKVARGQIMTVNDRDLSAKYRIAIDNYIKKGGNVTKEERKALQDEWLYMMGRVLADMDVVFSTCNTAGSEILVDSFKPSIITCDEAGHVTLASLAVVLTQFQNWQALYLLGDPKQLFPFSQAGMFNEFRNAGRQSALGFLEAKKMEMHHLKTQYRMAPQVVQFPSTYFYDGKIENHAAVNADNKWRKAMRNVTRDYYKVQGGSEYLVIDVVHGVSRLQANGTSLVNHANSEVIATFVDRILAEGDILPHDITVLSYYAGQLGVTFTSLRNKLPADSVRSWEFGSTDYVRISTVDSYQGRENKIVIVDLVVGHVKSQAPQSFEAEESEDEEGHQFGSTSAKVSSRVKDAHRLCCAITRGQNGLVVVCKGTTILSTVRRKQSHTDAAISALYNDAGDRKLLYFEDTTRDNSPEAIEARQHFDEGELARLRQQTLAERDAFMDKNFPRLYNR